MVKADVRQLSVAKLLFLAFFPGIMLLGGYFALLSAREFIPPLLSLLGLALIILVPILILIIGYYSKQEYGTFSLKSAFVYNNSIPAGKLLLKSIIPFALAAMIFVLVAPIENHVMFSSIFSFVPEYFKLSDFLNQLGQYSRGIIIATCVVYCISNGIIAPIAEELYFRGFLMPRIARFGKAAPVIIGVLFSLYHLFSPWENITRILAVIPYHYVVWKNKNIYIGIIVHCSLNLVSCVTTVLSVVNGMHLIGKL